MGKRDDGPVGPRLPAARPRAGSLHLVNDLQLSQLTLDGAECSGQAGLRIALDELHVLRSRFTGASLLQARFQDLLVEETDFSGADLEEVVCSRVEFKGCRLSGVLLPRGHLRDVVFTDCRMDGANLRMVQAERIRFDHVDLRGAEFSMGQLAAASFFDCNLEGAEFSHTVVPGARFHGSSMMDMKGAEYLRQIVIDSSQVLPLALQVFSALGIAVDDEREPPAG